MNSNVKIQSARETQGEIRSHNRLGKDFVTNGILARIPVIRRLATGILLLGLAATSPALAQVAVAPPETKNPANEKAATETKDDVKTAAEGKADAQDEPEYLRITKDANERPTAMQTAVVRYRGKPGTAYAGRTVDLFGVVHIGEGEYYDDINQRLSTYDVVLYELVAPDGTRIRPEDLQARRSVLASMQTGMKDMLNLQYQLEKVDYMATNFRHADMTPEEFSEDLARRGDSIWKMLGRMMGAGIATQAKTGGDAGILLAMFSEDRPKRMKRAMAKQLVDMESVTAGLDDANGENTLIKGRNGKAMRILKEELDAGKQSASIFYGAGHLPDLADRLDNDFGMEPVRTEWMTAWDLTTN